MDCDVLWPSLHSVSDKYETLDLTSDWEKKKFAVMKPQVLFFSARLPGATVVRQASVFLRQIHLFSVNQEV